MESKQEIKVPKLKIILRIFRVLIYIVAVLFSFTYFFNIFGLIIGIIYFIVFRKAWRLHGFILALAIAIGTFLPQIIGSQIEMYPLFFVATLNYGTIGIYFVGFTIFKIWTKLESKGKVKALNWNKLNFTRKLSPKLYFVFLSVVILSPTILWSSVSINFNVMFNNKPTLLWVNTPSTVDLGETFRVSVQSWDEFERLSATYKGTVDFSIESYNLTTLATISLVDVTLPTSYLFTGRNRPAGMAYNLKDGRDYGQHVFQASINTPGIHYILVHDSETDNTYYSNPIIAKNTPTDIYWGDIHSHSILSDGSGSANHAFFYARYVAQLDFCALTDHAEIMNLGFNWQEIYKLETDRAYEINEFVTFYGMEYTNHLTGHFTCIFDGAAFPEDPLIDSRDPSLSTPNELWDLLDEFTTSTGSRVLALPHHTTKVRYMQDWSYFNPKYVKIAEVSSVHGDSLYDPYHPLNYRGMSVPPPTSVNGSSITDALKMGYRITLYASSDGHDGHPGHTLSQSKAYIGHQRPYTYWWTRNDKRYPGGLTAIYANDLSRDTVFTSLQNRFIFSSSDHGRPILNFTINGVGIGGNSTITVDNSTVARDIQIFIAQDGAPASTLRTPALVTDNWIPNWAANVEILKNGELLTSIPITSPIARLNFTDSSIITGAAYGSQSCINVDGTYYLNEYSDNPISNPAELTTNGVDFYIIRIVGQNGRHSYIGPIWVEIS